MNNTNSLCYNSMKMLKDLINSVIAIHLFYDQLHFLYQPRVTYGRVNFQAERCPAVIDSVNF